MWAGAPNMMVSVITLGSLVIFSAPEGMYTLLNQLPIATDDLSKATTSGLHSTVSWQSAFWALVPLAMNSMTQPAGRWFGVHNPEMSFALRSSPIFCACDALHAMLYLAWHTFQTKSLQSALQKTARRRFRDATTNDGRTSPALPQSVKLFRIALFSFGALPQLVKLLGVHGLKWTTTWGLLFAGSFSVLEVLIYIAKDMGQEAMTADQQENPNDSYESGLEFYLAHATGFTNIALSMYLNTLVAHHIIELIVQNTWPYLLGLATLALATIVSTILPGGEQLSAAKALIRVPMHAIFALSFGLLAHLSADAQATGSRVKLGFDVLAMTLLALGLFGSLLYWYNMMGVRKRARYVDEGAYVYFAFCNALTALLYYALVYDPAGTLKPAWTNQLG